ncbi:DNA-directed RNA polymerase subunit alpha [Babesia sp. Xinjiang]|uniref:DNA-directed RNA polymerase subunit alpha n=1 Tax=Babesia sp. Xinjiang TaxID=462227 RepID=UPI000A221DE4|nr:DNA-directed RNA polymerase subunit alpha [Babesia sp. Xinjiang]XP_028872104.1 DNA-directed RNA polymerase subunit alpha [Babesia sp. Xinjiang]ORM41549.1 DNA-directed RNA polymerase subunit alpha [Babesia sp. Xinjiang]ORM41648.1 DNA-directed RNA polymerase subunit alpha [Babesia sp. Xinjiang]
MHPICKRILILTLYIGATISVVRTLSLSSRCSVIGDRSSNYIRSLEGPFPRYYTAFIAKKPECIGSGPKDNSFAPKAYLKDDSHTYSIGVPESKLPQKKLPGDDAVPLENQPMPPWALEFVTGNGVPKEPYTPRHYSEAEIAQHFKKVNEETRSRSVTKRLEESKGAPIKSYGFKFKQIQPVRHHNGRAFTFYYAHSLHTDVIPVLLNSLRRVAKRHLGAGRITALRIPGMKNEFYSVVGLREDFFDLAKNLTNVIFRNVPLTATFDKPLIGRLRLKGPIIAVAGHIELDQIEQTEGRGSSSGSTEDTKIEIVNKNHYICALADDAYLNMEVKIEYIANHVIRERGPESINRDITPDGFIHFPSSCEPVEIFAFDGDRRGMDEESTSEIVTLEIHTDGSTTPRLALLNSATFLETWFDRTLKALHNDCNRDLDALYEAKRSVTAEEMMHRELYRNVPWNPYRTPDERMSSRYRWFYRKDVKRQYPIDPESKMAKAEQLSEWKQVLENQMKYEELIKPQLTDDSDAAKERHLTLGELEEMADFKAPLWVFQDPLGSGTLSQGPVFEYDKDENLLEFPIE